MRQAAASALVGAVLIAVDLALHVYGRALGAGIGLLCVPLLTFLFARWVDGSVLYYRTWGRLQQLPLASVTGVATGGWLAGGGSVLLSAPGLAKPLRITVRSRGYAMSSAARGHLHGWLSGPQVQWTPQAALLFSDQGVGHGSGTRGRGWLLVRVLAVGLPLLGVGICFWVVLQRSPALAIPGAPGYGTFTGPLGRPLPVGRPWGEPCQPVRFTVDEHVPQWVYVQIAATVAQARSDGIDVTIENRQFYWTPSSLYYVSGQSPGSTVRVSIFTNDGTPPELASGRPEHIELIWNARPDPDGRHEDLELAQGDLWMQPLTGDPQTVRLAVRQLIAMTQGVMDSSQPNSAIIDGSTVDNFTPSDIAAMQRMSGCDVSSGSTV
ncbi:MAG TPA: hypothetical protein VGG41_01040 [Solirubrobacteraceae bacterium]|jgi:hypothetical protein